MILLIMVAETSATTSVPATTQVYSTYGSELIVRIEPGSNITQDDDYGLPFSEQNAIAVYVRYDEGSKSYRFSHSVRLANGVAPLEAHLHETGILITVDNFGGGTANGPAVAIYSAAGQTVATYALSDIYPQDVVLELKRAEDNERRSWRHQKDRSFIARNRFVVPDVFGNAFYFNIYNGTYEYK